MQHAIGFALVMVGAVLLGTWPRTGFLIFCGGAWLVGTGSGASEDRFMGCLFVLAVLGVIATFAQAIF